MVLPILTIVLQKAARTSPPGESSASSVLPPAALAHVPPTSSDVASAAAPEGDDEDMSGNPEAKRARVAKVTGVDVCVGDETLTCYHSDEYLADCAADVPLSDQDDDFSDDEFGSDDEGQLPPECTPPLELFFPFSTSDPQLTEDEMARLIHVADQHEISRLERMTVLQPPLEGVEYSKLSTRFVRSFRPKPHPVTKAPSLLFRSRLVAREYKRAIPSGRTCIHQPPKPF